MVTRREVMTMGAIASGLPAWSAAGAMAALAPAEPPAWAAPEFDVPQLELSLELVVTCTRPEPIGGEPGSKDGERRNVWPIIGGRFVGADIRGTVVPGGGDFPVTRPDGVTVIDALYRLRTDDGMTIIIHNKGLGVPSRQPGGPRRYRLSPQFTAPRGRYDWLNTNVFVANLTTAVPPAKRLAKGDDQNDRLIHVYRLG
jgi:hypothetical protein